MTNVLPRRPILSRHVLKACLSCEVTLWLGQVPVIHVGQSNIPDTN